MNNVRNNNMRKSNQKNRKKKTLIIVDIVLLVLILAVGYMFRNTILDWVANTFYTPDHKSAFNNSNNIEYVDSNNNKVSPGDLQEGNYNILCIGKDDIALNTDVMILVNINTKKDCVTAMQIPRDTFFTYNSVPVKFNSMFARVYNGKNTEEDKKKGLQEMTDILSKNLSVHIDYYAMIDLKGVAEMVDLIGGVEMYVPYDMKYNDPGQNLYINLKEGQQTLTGDQARQYVRFRSGYVQADVGRQDAQKVFIVAFLNNFRMKYTDVGVKELISKMEELLITNIPSNDMLYFALKARTMDFNNIRMLSAPGNPQYYNGVSYYVINREAVYNIIKNYYSLVEDGLTLAEESFDKDRNFTLLTDASINHWYTMHLSETTEYTAQEISDNGIDILLK